ISYTKVNRHEHHNRCFTLFYPWNPLHICFTRGEPPRDNRCFTLFYPGCHEMRYADIHSLPKEIPFSLMEIASDIISETFRHSIWFPLGSSEFYTDYSVEKLRTEYSFRRAEEEVNAFKLNANIVQ
ncbi:hypothetical protein HHI36_013761, partial [Cryptolaemus montrouzieri]